MDIIKYRKWYLEQNWGTNEFIMVKIKTHTRRHEAHLLWLNNCNHPMVNSGKAFWVNDHELCMGYELRENTQIFRPIFSHKRQDILDKVNKNIYNPIKFWNKLKSKYFYSLCYIIKLPIECVKIIVMFTSK